jgi:hypothetical protein
MKYIDIIKLDNFDLSYSNKYLNGKYFLHIHPALFRIIKNLNLSIFRHATLDEMLIDSVYGFLYHAPLYVDTTLVETTSFYISKPVAEKCGYCNGSGEGWDWFAFVPLKNGCTRCNGTGKI